MINNSEFRPEERLLILCARTSVFSEKRDEILVLLQEKIDWRYFIEITKNHRLTPLIYKNFYTHFSDLIPKPILAELQEYYQTNVWHALSMTAELTKLTNRMNEKAIPYIPFKGPVLASAIYNNIALRQFGDLDFLIHQEDFFKVKELLEVQGYTSQLRLTPWQQEYLLEYANEQAFSRDKLHVDVHWAMDPGYLSSCRRDTDESLWENLASVSLGGKMVKTFSPENLILTLCSHGAKHGWSQLNLVCDVAEIIRTYPSVHWDWILKKVNELYSERTLLLGLCLVRDLFEVNLPEEMIHRIEKHRKVQLLAGKAEGRFFQKRNAFIKFCHTCSFYPATLENLGDKVHYYLSFVRPTPAEWMLLPLPKFLAWFYYFLRPVRLFGKYVSMLWRR